MDGPFLKRSEAISRLEACGCDFPSGLAGLVAPFFGEVDISPAREAVFEIPLALAVAQKNKMIHNRQRVFMRNALPEGDVQAGEISCTGGFGGTVTELPKVMVGCRRMADWAISLPRIESMSIFTATMPR